MVFPPYQDVFFHFSKAVYIRARNRPEMVFLRVLTVPSFVRRGLGELLGTGKVLLLDDGAYLVGMIRCFIPP